MKKSDLIKGEIPQCFQSDIGLVPTNRCVLMYIEYMVAAKTYGKKSDIIIKVANHIYGLSMVTRKRPNIIRSIKDLDSEFAKIKKHPNVNTPRCRKFFDKFDSPFPIFLKRMNSDSDNRLPNAAPVTHLNSPIETTTETIRIINTHPTSTSTSTKRSKSEMENGAGKFLKTTPNITATRLSISPNLTPDSSSPTMSRSQSNSVDDVDPFLFQDESSMESLPEGDTEYKLPYHLCDNKTYNMTPMTKAARSWARFGTSYAEASTCASSVIADMGQLKHATVITKKKVRSQVKVQGGKEIEKLSHIEPGGFWFDGKKEKVPTWMNGRRTYTEKSHYTIVQQGGEQKYLGFFANEDATGVGLATEILAYFDNRGISSDKIELVGCDGTAVNTGYNNGALFHLHRMLKRSIQWAVCFLHHLELPMRHFFCKLDNVSVGIGIYNGKLGKVLATNVWELSLSEFEKITVDKVSEYILPQYVVNSLSTDGYALYKLVIAVITGECPPQSNTARNVIGKLDFARWLTFASRVLRLYMSAPVNHRAKLTLLAHYIVKVYYKTHAAVKYKPSIVDAPEHLFNEITNIKKHCSIDQQEVLFKAVRKNAFYSHPHSIQVAVLGDKDKNVRSEGVKMVLSIRKRVRDDNITIAPTLEQHILPELNIEATHYSKMYKAYEHKSGVGHGYYRASQIYGKQLRGNRIRLTEAPLLRKFTDYELKQFEETPFESPYLCHAQPCERGVKLTSDSCSQKMIYELQLGNALLTECGRREDVAFSHKRMIEKQ